MVILWSYYGYTVVILHSYTIYLVYKGIPGLLGMSVAPDQGCPSMTQYTGLDRGMFHGSDWFMLKSGLIDRYRSTLVHGHTAEQESAESQE